MPALNASAGKSGVTVVNLAGSALAVVLRSRVITISIGKGLFLLESTSRFESIYSFRHRLIVILGP